MSDAFSWLDAVLAGDDELDGDGGPDPWADVDVEPVDLTEGQQDFLASFTADQPAVPRLRRLTHPLAAFEVPDGEPDGDSRTGNAPDAAPGSFA